MFGAFGPKVHPKLTFTTLFTWAMSFLFAFVVTHFIPTHLFSFSFYIRHATCTIKAQVCKPRVKQSSIQLNLPT